ncbi:lysine N(6)-hydroxylase/L-ornithine N(5)-oxygenase family protein [Burkholderia metallica]|uniref:lysine N(6)-hydroxylase/L-ornithine N(5)-oxygenase family protein n=1 Tax=Burkholderia metallica TaxID=488729 RepID=UPI000D1C1E1E|nr:SidA/IucD/PvdA family monooxygenase [Burkholderia metallica]
MANESYECIGVGCGPSNLSIASQLYGLPHVHNIFFEKKSEFSWHGGMMLPDVSLQVSMFKDLVTLAEPTNQFSFVSYLHRHDRLLPFLNARFERISRREFADYLRWAAHTNENISFGEHVESVDFDGAQFVVETSRRRVYGKNVVVGVGIEAHVPPFARNHIDGETQFHVHTFAHKPRFVGGQRVVVIGGGQSGAEAVLELLRRTGEDAPSQVSWLSRRENFSPIDDSPFANDLFTPSHSNFFFGQEAAFRNAFLERNVLASDGISEHTLRDIYQRVYTLRYIERSPMVVRLMPFRDILEVWRAEGAWALAARHLGTHAHENLNADVVVWATGFRSAAEPFMNPLAARLVREDGEIRVDRDYAAIWDGPADRRIFVLNGARRQRGLADPNLSLTAWRGQIVIDRMLNRTRGGAPDLQAFVNWAALEN